jgi:dihydrofolate reductase
VRKLVVLEHISLDGVIQAPGGPEEDTSGGFAHGGWEGPYSDETLGALLSRRMSLPFDLLLGRRTFEIWAPFWPHHGDEWPGVNTATKYVASNSMTAHEWQPSVFLSGDVPAKVHEIKQRPGPDLNVWGSANLLQTLMKHDLVDAFWLMVYPITLGSGKRLFADGTIPAVFKVTEGQVTPSGVIVVNYVRSGGLSRES